MSQANYISRKALNLFSNNELDLIYNQEKLKDFIGLPFSIENIEKQIELKNASFSSAQRDTLCDVLYREYKNFENNNISLEQIDRLRQSNTYTITTGHQLCFLGGPMYFVWQKPGRRAAARRTTLPTTPGSTPSTPASEQEGASSGGGGCGYKQR